jgi:hypothetical protein
MARQVNTIPLLKILALVMIRSTENLAIMRTATRIAESSPLLDAVLCLLLAPAICNSHHEEAASVRYT